MGEFIAGILGFAAGILFSWYALVAIVCGCIWCEHKESRGWAVFLAFLLGIVVFNLFNIPWANFWWVAVGYLPFGFFWSFWRWHRYVDEEAKDFDKRVKRMKSDLEENIKRLTPKHDGQIPMTESALNEMKQRHKDEVERQRQYALEHVKFRENVGSVVYWILMWPFSFIAMFCSDIIEIVAKTVRSIGRWTYEKISARAEGKIRAVVAEDE